jgi:hypothetical protein
MITINLMMIFKIICLILLAIEFIILAAIKFKDNSVKTSGLILIMLMTLLPFIYIIIKE